MSLTVQGPGLLTVFLVQSFEPHHSSARLTAGILKGLLDFQV